MGRMVGCSCFELLEDIGTAAGTAVAVYTASGQTFNLALRENVTATDRILRAIRTGGRYINFCCGQIIAIEAR
ncbi:hypothetical protein ABHN11_10790 [Brevibacillus centrosporus]|uniref:hypothetical protein n=1 Tax=Brevibacillus centrosporus TaxID=54910 RepID=UPI003D25A655